MTSCSAPIEPPVCEECAERTAKPHLDLWTKTVNDGGKFRVFDRDRCHPGARLSPCAPPITAKASERRAVKAGWMSLRLECIVPAGGRPEPGDDLWPHTGGRPKALLELDGRPMVRWVIDALLAARFIERIILVGLERDALPQLPAAITVVPEAGSLVANLYAGVANLSRPGPAAFCWSDVPLIRPEMIDRFVETTEDPGLDVNVGLVDRRDIQAPFAGPEDSWIRLREGRFTALGLRALPRAACRAHAPPLRGGGAATQEHSPPGALRRHRSLAPLPPGPPVHG